MNRLEEIKKLFPLPGNVTASIIKRAKVEDVETCIGALTLKKALGKHLTKNDIVYWAST